MVNLQRITPKIKMIMTHAKSSVSMAHTRQCYRNRVGIDDILLDNVLIQPMLFFSALRMFNENFTEWLAPDFSAISAALEIKNKFPTNKINLRYSGDNPVNINAVIQTMDNSIAFATNTVGLGEVIEIINYRTKEALTNDAEVIEQSGKFTRAPKATEVLLTASPNTLIRIYEKFDDDGTIRIILTHGLARSTVERLKVLVFADQLAYLNTSESEEDKTLAELVTQHSERIMPILTGIITEAFAREFIEMFFMEKAETLDKVLQEAAMRKLMEQLDNIPQQMLRDKLNALENRRYELRSALENYMAAEKRYTEAHNALVAVQHGDDEIIVNIKKFFTALGVKLKDLAVTNEKIYVIADTVLTYFDGKKLGYYKSNPRSSFSQSPAWEQNLLEKVFETRTVKLHITAGFQIHLRSGRIDVVRRGTSVSNSYNESMRTGIPNPHHEHYNCFGDNQRICNDLVEKGKLDEALMTVYAALGGINISDSAVFNSFLEDLRHDNYRNLAFIEVDGEMITPTEYRRRYEKEQEEKANA